MTYPKSVGRNFDEILRAVDALQTTDSAAVSTPVDWRKGDKLIVPPTVSTDDAREKYNDVEEHYPYLRTTSGPKA
jgi:alkyl hydroperoxide reductase subunit AhpC